MATSASSSKSSGSPRRVRTSPTEGGSVDTGMHSDTASGPPRVVAGQGDLPYPAEKRSQPPTQDGPGGHAPQVEGEGQSWGAPPTQPPHETSSDVQEVRPPRVVAGHTDTPRPLKKRPGQSQVGAPPNPLSPTQEGSSPSKSSSSKRSREEEAEPATPKKIQRGESNPSNGGPSAQMCTPRRESPVRSPPPGLPPRETLTDFSPMTPSKLYSPPNLFLEKFWASAKAEIATPTAEKSFHRRFPVDSGTPGHVDVSREDLKEERLAIVSGSKYVKLCEEYLATLNSSGEEIGEEEDALLTQQTPPSPSRSSVSKRKRESDGEEGAESIQRAPPSVPHSSGSKRSRQSDGEEDTKRVQQAPPSMPHSSGSKRAREQEETPSKSSKRPREAQEEVEPPFSVSRYNLRDTPARRRFRASQTERKQVRAKDLSKRSK